MLVSKNIKFRFIRKTEPTHLNNDCCYSKRQFLYCYCYLINMHMTKTTHPLISKYLDTKININSSIYSSFV